jgi:hypothetical protein
MLATFISRIIALKMEAAGTSETLVNFYQKAAILFPVLSILRLIE